MANNKQMITNTVHILTSGKVPFHLLYADNNKQIDVNYTEYIQNETVRLSFDSMGNTSCTEPNLLPLQVWLLFLLHDFLYTIHNVGIY